MGAPEKKSLVEQHLPLVQSIARKVKRTLSAAIDIEDLVGYGSKGLVEAAERFDARHGVAFTTFAYYRIKGAMFDGLRTMGWYSRADYARYRAEERANEYLQSHADREGDPAGKAADNAEALAAVAQVLSGVAAVHITSLEAASNVPDQTFASP